MDNKTVFACLMESLSTYTPESGYFELYNAAVLSLMDCDHAVIDYRKTADVERLNRDLIGVAMDFVLKWENWLETVEAPQMKHPSSKSFHTFLLRYVKGAIKAWRIWRIDLRK